MKIGIVSDIHEDVSSLKKALTLFNSHACDHIVCLGDSVGVSSKAYASQRYQRNATETLSIIKSICSVAVIGNHDLFAVKKIPLHTMGFSVPQQWYQLSQSEKNRLSNGKIWLYEDELATELQNPERDYLWSLPEFTILHCGGYSIGFSHSLSPDLSGSTKTLHGTRSSLKNHALFMSETVCDLWICGHLHIQGVFIGSIHAGWLKRLIVPPFRFYHFFESFTLFSIHKVLLVPAVADFTGYNGVVIIDTHTSLVQIHSLSSY